jgi:hypothetical protein
MENDTMTTETNPNVEYHESAWWVMCDDGRAAAGPFEQRSDAIQYRDELIALMAKGFGW